jgi:hypothetical protein
MAFTGYYRVGDYVDIVAIDAQGCQVGANLATGLIVSAIDDDVSMVFNTTVDTSTALPAGAVAYHVIPNDILTGEEAIDRLYRSQRPTVQICVDATPPSELDTPLAGQSRHLVNDIHLIRTGDSVSVISDSGLLGTALVVSVAANADETNNLSEIVLDDNIDTTGETNVQICVNLSIKTYLERLKGDIDLIDRPVENEYMGAGNGTDTAFLASNLFLASTSHVYLDGRKLRLGTAGTRASLTVGTFPANDDSLRFTSLILGTLGNEVRVRLQAGAGLTVAVTKTFQWTNGALFTGSDYLITVNDNGGAATAAQIAAAINADATAKRIVLAQYGDDGAGVPAPFGPTALTGGLNDGTGDYAELPQVYENNISLTGYKWVSLHIRPSESNRLDRPALVTEEMVIDYRRALTNA